MSNIKHNARQTPKVQTKHLDWGHYIAYLHAISAHGRVSKELII